ncbi:Vacuolar ATP synthase subunit C [Sorochytrium milnesiophthora]
MSNYWIISVPSGGNKADAFEKTKKAQHEAADVYPFVIPELKVGTLDSLVTLSDDLAKTDQVIEGAVNKVVDIMRNLLAGDTEQLQNNLAVNDQSVESYLRTFQWNAMKYRVDKPLREEVAQIDSMMKVKASAYNQVRSTLQTMQRRETGNLAIRNLAGVVKREHFVLDSEFLTTVLVAVPKNNVKDWNDSYETLTEMVVPRSAIQIAQDSEYTLFGVTMFQKVVDQFVNKCRERKYAPREFKFDEKELAAAKREAQELTVQEKQLWDTLLRLCKTNFGEVFSSWIHIKALRVFVESILRYGLPPDFMSCLIRPKSKQDKKARDVLNQMYGSLGGLDEYKSRKKNKQLETQIDEMSLIAGVDREFLPYVNFAFVWDIAGVKY